MLGTDYPCSRAVFTAVNTAREHGRHFWTPVNTGQRGRQALLLMTSWLFSTCRTGVQNDTRVHGPCSRPVNTGSVHTGLWSDVHYRAKRLHDTLTSVTRNSWFFEFLKVQWLYFTGEVDRHEISLGFRNKNNNLNRFMVTVIQKMKGSVIIKQCAYC